jgi:hypothetical protein
MELTRLVGSNGTEQPAPSHGEHATAASVANSQRRAPQNGEAEVAVGVRPVAW